MIFSLAEMRRIISRSRQAMEVASPLEQKMLNESDNWLIFHLRSSLFRGLFKRKIQFRKKKTC